MPPRKRAASAADSAPIVGGFSVVDNATAVPDKPTNLPPPEAADTLDPVVKPDVNRRIGKLEKNLTDTYGTIGVMVGMVDRYCGQTIVDEAPKMAQSMAEWADEDPKVKEILLKLTTASAFGKVFAAHAPVLIAIGSHHIPAIRNSFYGPPAEATPEETKADDYGNPVV